MASILTRIINAVAPSTRSLENPAVSLSDWPAPTPNGQIPVSADTAFMLSAVKCAVKVISDGVSSLDFYVYRRENGEIHQVHGHPIERLLNLAPSKAINADKFTKAMMLHLLLKGNAYILINRNGAGDVAELQLLSPHDVEVVHIDGDVNYHYQGRVFTSDQIAHISDIAYDGLTASDPINQARDVLALSMAVQSYGVAFFQNGATPGSYYKVPQKLDEPQTAALRKQLKAVHGGPKNAHEVAILGGGVEWVQTSTNPNDAQAIETRQFQILEVCRLFNITPNKLHDLSQASFSNIEETNRDFYQNSIRPWVYAILTEFNLKVFNRPFEQNLFLDVRLADTLAGNMSARAAYNRSCIASGMKSINECRAEENLNGIGPAGDKHIVQSNQTTLDRIGEVPYSLDAQDGKIDGNQDSQEGTPEPASAIRGVVLDAAQRMARREAASLRKAVAKGTRAADLEHVWRDLRPVLVEALSPSVGLVNSLTDGLHDPETLADRWIDRSRSDFRGAKDVDTVLSRWEERAEVLVAELMEGA